MKKVMIAVLAMGLWVPVVAFAQNTAQQPNTAQQNNKTLHQEQNQAAETDEMGLNTQPQHTMAGMVSNGGKTLTSGDTSYVVNNPKALRKYDNQSVSVKFLFNSNNNNTIHILSASPVPAQ
jgi:cytoskeletal protein RodZ